MMGEAQIRAVLADIAAQGVPAETDLWPRVRIGLDEVRARRGQGRAALPRARLALLPTRLPPLAVVLLFALVGVVLIGTGYAALPLIQQQLSQSPEGRQMLAYGKTMRLTRTVSGVTISLDFAYADQSGGLLGYTITAPDGQAFGNQLDQVTLTSDGRPIPIVGGSGTGEQAGMTGNFVSFGRIGKTSGPAQVPLRLTIGAVDTSRPDGTTRTLPGPWVFALTAPVAPTTFVRPRQTVIADGWPMTLESVAVTPPGTWITLQGAGPDADVELIAGGKAYHLYADGFVGGPNIKTCFAAHRRCPELWKDQDTTYQATAMEPECSLLCRLRGDKPGLQEDRAKTAEWMRDLAAAHGEWTIVVKPDPSFTDQTFALRGGPWVFHVRIP